MAGIAVVVLCGLNCCCSVMIFGLTYYLETGGVMSDTLSSLACSGLFFSLGFTAGYCFYVPQSLYAMEFGGADSGTVR